jgi:hypothetical protein
VRRGSASFAIAATIAAIGIVLAWWSAADVGHGLTYGCVVQTSTGPQYCTARDGPLSVGIILGLSASNALMAWDAWSHRTPPHG